MASAYELRKLLNSKRSVHEETFNEITQRCLRTVMRHSATCNIDHVIFRIPRYEFGKAIYDFEECKTAVVRSLTQLGYVVTPHDTDSIRVSWQDKPFNKRTRTEDWIQHHLPNVDQTSAGVEYSPYDSISPLDSTTYPLGTIIRMPSRVAMRTDASWQDTSR